MTPIPPWHVAGDWFDVCKCNVPCPCTFAQALSYGDCDGVLAYHIRQGHYGEVPLDGLNLLGVARFVGNIWSGETKAAMGLFIDHRVGSGPRSTVRAEDEQRWWGTPWLTNGLEDLRQRGLSPTPTCSESVRESIYKAAFLDRRMSGCCDCEAIDHHFGAARAADELATYARRGPTSTTRVILRALSELTLEAETLLDIGAGVGVLHHELLCAGLRSAVHVEAAQAYVDAARAESVRRGHAERVRFLHGDFVTLAPALDSTDLVTIDRVVCCYRELEPLVGASVAKARRYYAISYPHDRWYVRAHTGPDPRPAGGGRPAPPSETEDLGLGSVGRHPSGRRLATA